MSTATNERARAQRERERERFWKEREKEKEINKLIRKEDRNGKSDKNLSTATYESHLLVLPIRRETNMEHKSLINIF